VAGNSVTFAAAGASGETVHRWLREDAVFRATLNRTRGELHEAVAARLLACSQKAAENVAAAVAAGDLRISLVVLKGLGSLPGSAPTVGVTDPESLREMTNSHARNVNGPARLRRLLATSW
jgi:hypothetical protein